MRRSIELSGELPSGEIVSFSYAAYIDAMQRYSLRDTEAVVLQVEAGSRERSGVAGFLAKFGVIVARAEPVPEETANFFRNFAVIQEVAHLEYDRGIAIGSLATRIQLALGQIPSEKLTPEFYASFASARREYDLVFT